MQPMNPTPSPQRDSDLHAPLVTRATVVPFVLITTLFFLWAIPNNLNDVLIRQFMKSFVLNRIQAGLVQSAFYIGYFLLAMPAALIMRRFGYKSGFLIGLSLFSLGSFLFWPAAVVNRYAFFLGALFVIASGLSFLETASNSFISQLGDPRSAARRLNLAQAFNPVGSITGVLIGTIFIFSGVNLTTRQIAALHARHAYHAYLHTETMRVVGPYLVIAAVTLFMLVLIAVTKFPEPLTRTESLEEHGGSFRALLRHPGFVFAVLAQFAYVGAQIGSWSFFILYVVAYTHEQDKGAGYLLTTSLAAFLVGRFFSAWLMRFIHPSRLMAIYCAANTLLVLVGIVFPGWVGVWALLLTSFFMSLMFPTIFAQGIRGLGPNTKLGGSLMVMAIVGGAVLTPLMALIAHRTGSQALSYLVPLAAYVFVGFYALADLRITRAAADRVAL